MAKLAQTLKKDLENSKIKYLNNEFLAMAQQVVKRHKLKNICEYCQKKVVFISHEFSEEVNPTCPNCGAEKYNG